MQIVILGAGYGGLRTALDLDRLLREHGHTASVTLVDQNNYHQVVQVLHLTATAGIHSRESIYQLDRLLRTKQISLVQGRVERIAHAERYVELADQQRLPYDRLVIALGSETAYYNIPGAREHTLPLRTYDQALALREHLTAQFRAAAANPSDQRVLMTTAIVGGGFTGCQLAGELADWSAQLCEETGAPRNEVRIALLDRGPRLLSQFGEWAGKDAERTLDRLGVSVYLNTLIESVEPKLLRVEGNRVIRAATIVWTAGVKAPDLLANSGLPTDRSGRVYVDRYLRVRDQGAIFALGDCAAIPDGPDSMVPATASYATRQGEHMAETLLAEIGGQAPRPYEPLHLGELVSLGAHYAIGNPLGVPITGYPALLMKKGVEQYYRGTIEAA